MFLECLYPEVVNSPSWKIDVTYSQTTYLIGTNLDIAEARGYETLTVRPFHISSRLEALAEEMLARAAAEKRRPYTLATIRELYRRHPFCGGLDVPFGQVLRLRGQDVAVPDPWYLGRHYSNTAGEANLVLWNGCTVLPVLT